VLAEAPTDLGDREVRAATADRPGRAVSPGGEPFVNDPGVLFLTLVGIIGAEEEITVFAGAEGQRNDSLAGLFVEAVAGKLTFSTTSHAAPTFRNSEDFRIISGFQCRTSDHRKVCKLHSARDLNQMGATGFEPVTPSVSRTKEIKPKSPEGASQTVVYKQIKQRASMVVRLREVAGNREKKTYSP
jgi:hypothetical protein